MIDKRFWAGAILVLTFAIAGAGSLPALLLRPALPDPAAVAPVAAMRIAETVQVAEPVVAKANPAPVAPVPMVAVAETPKPAPLPPPQPVAVASPEPSPVSVPEPRPVAFPPVQPVGIAMPGQPVVKPPSDVGAATTTVREPEKTTRAERATAKAAGKPKRIVRPAPYPMREFLAWR